MIIVHQGQPDCFMTSYEKLFGFPWYKSFDGNYWIHQKFEKLTLDKITSSFGWMEKWRIPEGKEKGRKGTSIFI